MKNLLSDTDSQSGHDNRFKSAVLIGRVSEIVVNDKGANVRVSIPDRVDHQNQPLITKPIPVLQTSSGHKRSFAMPRIGQNVVIVKLASGTSDYAAVGFFYTKNDPPPVTDPLLDYCEYDDGSTMEINANNGEVTWRMKGKIDVQSEKQIIITSSGDKVTVEGSSDVLVKSDNGTVTVEGNGNVIVKSDSGAVTIQATTINLVGNIVHTGNIVTSGVHTDANGVHH